MARHGRLMELVRLGDLGHWDKVQALGRNYLQETHWVGEEPLMIWSWLAVADVWMGGEDNFREADVMSTHAMNAATQSDGSVVIARACVLMAEGEEVAAESLMKRAGDCHSSPPAVKTLAHLWVALYEKRGEEALRSQWEQVARAEDPEGIYRLVGRLK